jgi:flagellar biosynthesis protein FliR
MFAEIGAANQKFILTFFRVAAIMWLLPIFSSRSVSVYFKAAFALAVAFLLQDTVTTVRPLTSDTFSLTIGVLREVFIGLTIGFFVRILFMIVTVAGEIVSFQTGLSFAQFMDPITNTQVSPLVQVKNLLAVLIFFAIDAHHSIIKGLAASFGALPIGAATLQMSLLQYIVGMTGKIFSAGFRIGAPIIVTLFLVELALGLLSRMIPQINVFVEGVSIKILVTILVFSFSLAIIAPGIAGLFTNIDTEMVRILRMMV